MAKLSIKKKVYPTTKTFNKKSHFSDYEKLNRKYFSENDKSVATKYIKESKKPKKLSTLIVNILVICSLVLLIVVLTTVSVILTGGGGSGPILDGKDNVHGFRGLLIAPEIPDAKMIDISSFDDDKAKAEYLYQIASQKVTDTPYFTAYNKGMLFLKMGSGKNYLDIDAVTMKTQKEYFNIVYHLNNSVPILDSPIGAIIARSADVITTERTYATASSKSMTYQKIKNNDRDENGVPTALWDSSSLVSTPLEKQLPKIPFSTSQNDVFYITNHTIKASTLSSAIVEHDEDGKFYKVTAVLDHKNPQTTQYSIADIRAGTGDTRAQFSHVSTEFTVWENGYLRSFDLLEKWSASVVISLNFELSTHWQCSYNKLDCNINKYPDAKAMKKALN